MMRPSWLKSVVGVCAGLISVLWLGGGGPTAAAGAEPDRATYWDVKEIRPGMKGTGRTVMVGTALEEFGAEVLGVMRDVSPGRDMVLCRLTGCNLEHAGIIQGMSGSPIYIDGKLLGAVAYAWEFAKDPIAGVTPFSQMVAYARANDRRIAAEAGDKGPGGPIRSALLDPAWAPEGPPGASGARRPRGGRGGPGRHAADRDPRWRPRGSAPGPWPCWASGSPRWAWPRWPAGPRRRRSSAARGTSPWCRARR
jgi:hypothetical protein